MDLSSWALNDENSRSDFNTRKFEYMKHMVNDSITSDEFAEILQPSTNK